MARLVTAGLVSLAIAASGCRGCSRPPEQAPPDDAGQGAPAIAVHASGPLAAPLPLFDDDPAHPYNELHRLLFGGAKAPRYTGCASEADGGCLDDPAVLAGVEATPSVQRTLPGYADRLIITADRDEALAVTSRSAEIAAVIRRLREIDPRSRPGAAVLLQHDVWAVFDALHGEVLPDEAVVLRDRLGLAMAALALPAQEIANLGPTLEDVLSSEPELFERARAEDLVEIVAEASEPPFEPPTVLTTHARMRASRSVFRRFVRVPGGPDAVRALATGGRTLTLPEGSLALIIETPLAVSREGNLVATRMVTLAETRRVIAMPPDPRLRHLGFDVLEGHRASLRSARPHLDRLAPGAPFPSTGSCGHDAASLVPMRKSCMLCHGAKGDQVSSFAHGDATMRLAAPLEAVDAVLREKAQRADFLALQRLFPRRQGE
jgi:hypothetical protein